MMSIFTILKTEPQNLISVDEVKDFLRISHVHDDKLLIYLTQSVIEFAESFTGICLNKKLIKCYVKLMRENSITLKYNPISKINKVVYQPLGASETIVDNYLFNKDTSELILPNQYYLDNLQIFYDAGMDITDLPLSFKQGFLEHIAHIYDGADNDNILPNKVKYCYLHYRQFRIT